MKQFVINVPDDKRSFFEELMHSLDFAITETSMVSEPILEWHKEIVLDRIANSTEEDYIPWDEAKLKIQRKNK
ncbi:MAG: hypothetical protein V4581_08540 [Bacteroidota bacterium]